MKTVSIICEYNPFHRGHKYQLDKIKEEFGSDTCIVAVMSGNYTQRGDFAIADKFTRAKIAVMEGASLVLELPFPYSMQSAEFFASSAVKIITEAVHSDVISFGSECGDATLLKKISQNMSTKEYEEAFQKLLCEQKMHGHPAICEKAYAELFGETKELEIIREPNNLLGIEYIKALYKQNPNNEVAIHTFKRMMASHNDTSPVDSVYSSASAIRAIFSGDTPKQAFSYLPTHSSKVCKEAYENGDMPTNSNRLSNAILAFLRINPPAHDTADSMGGIENRLRSCAVEAKDLNELVTMVSTKRYTNARIRRAIWNSYFGITSSDIRALPCYTQVLAMDDKGRKKLKEMKKTSTISILTKPADYVYLPTMAKSQAEISNRADLIFSLAKPVVSSGSEFLRSTPYCKK